MSVHLEAHDAGQVRLLVAVEEDIEPQVVVQLVLAALLQHARARIDVVHLAGAKVLLGTHCSQIGAG